MSDENTGAKGRTQAPLVPVTLHLPEDLAAALRDNAEALTAALKSISEQVAAPSVVDEYRQIRNAEREAELHRNLKHQDWKAVQLYRAYRRQSGSRPHSEIISELAERFNEPKGWCEDLILLRRTEVRLYAKWRASCRLWNRVHQGWSKAAIARTEGLHPSTVRRKLRKLHEEGGPGGRPVRRLVSQAVLEQRDTIDRLQRDAASQYQDPAGEA